jgi:hypothetical protein
MAVLLHLSSFDEAAAVGALRSGVSFGTSPRPSEGWAPGARQHLEVLGFDPDDASSVRGWAVDGQVAFQLARLVQPIREVAGYEAAASVLDGRGTREEIFRTLLGRPLAELAARAGLAAPSTPTWQFGGWVDAGGAAAFVDQLTAEADLANRQRAARAPVAKGWEHGRLGTDDLVRGIACLRELAEAAQQSAGSVRIVLR